MIFLKKNLSIVLLSVSVLVALFIYKDFGLSWDEAYQRDIGIVSYQYVFEGNENLLTFFNRDYGVAFELPLIIVEKVLGLTDTQKIFQTRHLVTHLFFLLSAFFLFKLVYKMFRSNTIAAAAYLMLVLQPRIYAHSFYNSKDIPNLSMTIICLYVAYIFFTQRKIIHILLLGACTGLLINLRVTGLMFLTSIVVIVLIDAYLNKTYKNGLKSIALYLLSSCVFLYASWPYLWGAPFERFFEIFENMSKFRWISSLTFNGEMIPSDKVPWYYISQWILMTTPVAVLLLFFVGKISFGVQLIREKLLTLKKAEGQLLLLALFIFLGAILALIILHSVVYDGWRQMFFIYPTIILFVSYLLSKLPELLNKMARGFLSINFIVLIVYSCIAHPLQGVYFNMVMQATPDEYLRRNFEFDYWGLSYLEAINFIAEHDKSDSIRVYVFTDAGIYNQQILPQELRDRFFIGRGDVNDNYDYYITNYRWHPNDYEEYRGKTYEKFAVMGNTVWRIFKLK